MSRKLAARVAIAGVALLFIPPHPAGAQATDARLRVGDPVATAVATAAAHGGHGRASGAGGLCQPGHRRVPRDRPVTHTVRTRHGRGRFDRPAGGEDARPAGRDADLRSGDRRHGRRSAGPGHLSGRRRSARRRDPASQGRRRPRAAAPRARRNRRVPRSRAAGPCRRPGARRHRGVCRSALARDPHRSTCRRRALAGSAERRLLRLPGGEALLRVADARTTVQRVFTIVSIVFGFVLTYAWLAIVLRRFPYTRPWGESLRGSLVSMAGVCRSQLRGRAARPVQGARHRGPRQVPREAREHGVRGGRAGAR